MLGALICLAFAGQQTLALQPKLSDQRMVFQTEYGDLEMAGPHGVGAPDCISLHPHWALTMWCCLQSTQTLPLSLPLTSWSLLPSEGTTQSASSGKAA